MFNMKKNRGFSFYDVIVSLMVLIIASVFVTRIFVGSVNVSYSNLKMNQFTFEAIETIEIVKSIGNVDNIHKNNYFDDYTKTLHNNQTVFTKQIDIDETTYTEVVSIELAETYTANKIAKVESFNNEIYFEQEYDQYSNNLYRIEVKILDDNKDEVYKVETYFTETHKVLS